MIPKRKVNLPASIIALAILALPVAVIVRALISFFEGASGGALALRITLLLMLLVYGAAFTRSDRVRQWTFQAFEHYFKFTIVLVASTLPAFAVYSALQFITVSVPPLLQVAAFIVWGLLLVAAIGLMSTDGRRRSLFRRLSRLGGLTPFVYALNVLIFAAALFSSITFLLHDHGVAQLQPGARQLPPQPGQVNDFYWWHFLQAIPLLDITETLRWPEPFKYQSSWVGLQLLLFKAIVIVPILSGFASFWRYRAEIDQQTQGTSLRDEERLNAKSGSTTTTPPGTTPDNS